MKKKYLALFILAIFLVSCRSPQQRPIGNNQTETNLSSIFGTAAVEHCRITAETTDVKQGLGFDFDTIATLRRDDVVPVLDQVGDWYVVRLDNNQIGSIDATTATPIVREVETGTPARPNMPAEETPADRATPDNRQGATQPQPRALQGPTVADNPPNATPQPDRLEPGSVGEERQPGTPRAATPNNENQRQGQTATTDLTAQEQQMVQLVNQERQRNGLPALQIDTEVARVAGVKSQDMVDNNYFSHYSPTYGSPFEMLDSFGVKYLHAGENLAGNNNVDSAHVALMNSSGHRQNILNPNFTHIGIGVRRSPRYGFVYTQMFISKPR